VTIEIFGVEQNLASGETRVRFRVWEQSGELHRVLDECRLTVEGRYQIDDPDLAELIENTYKEYTSA
jgi:hypothetical protein